jgi:hypothetical protein
MPPERGPSDRGGQGQEEAETARSLAMLLNADDLPGPGWGIVEERTWPTGQLDPESEKSRRALRHGGITAWRSLGQAAPLRSAWVEVVPYASAEDAELSLRQVPRYFVGTLRPGEAVMAEQVIEDRCVPGVSDTWILEKSTTGPEGDSLARYVGGTVDRILFLTCFSGRGEWWPWDGVLDLATLQSERVRQAL